MQTSTRVEDALEKAIARAQETGAPPRLASALRYAVFPGGHRIRPQLVPRGRRACGDKDPAAADAAAAAIELMHCASLVHDDLPCFDDADMRRGKASVHLQFGEPIAVLTGDALIVLAFETLASRRKRRASRMACAARAYSPMRWARRTASWPGRRGNARLPSRSRTTSAPRPARLFVGSTLAGAAAAGVDPTPWRMLGEKIGEAYQVADDLRDVLCDADELGKPIGQDAVRSRPNAAAELGIGGAKARLVELVDAAVGSIPDCPGAVELRKLIRAQTMQFFPKQLAAAVAA